MKTLSIALICMIMGLSTYAASPAVKNDQLKITKVESGSKIIWTSRTATKANKRLRIQRSFDFTLCGQTIRVYVSAPDGYKNGSEMIRVAESYISHHLNSEGCFAG